MVGVYEAQELEDTLAAYESILSMEVDSAQDQPFPEETSPDLIPLNAEMNTLHEMQYYLMDLQSGLMDADAFRETVQTVHDYVVEQAVKHPERMQKAYRLMDQEKEYLMNGNIKREAAFQDPQPAPADTAPSTPSPTTGGPGFSM